MNARQRLSDSDHPTLINLSARLAQGKETPLEKVKSIFHFVRDEIKFGFTPVWDEIKASEVLHYGLGYCNTKATLFVALCRVAGIPARVHFGLIDIRIMRGIMPGFVFPFLPKLGGHSWSEVQIDGQWLPVDSYINDKPFYERAVEHLKRSAQPIGYSVSYKDGRSSCEFNFGEKGFVHMGAVREDHGAWEDASDYFATDKYVRFNRLQAFAYPLLALMSNRNVARIRQSNVM
jgi:hypothetical protein